MTGVRFAVKRIADSATATPQQRQSAEQSMMRELEVLRTARHPHMIRLLGYSVPGPNSAELCLIYELGVHGSVAKNLLDDAKAAAFDWKHRVRALVGLASVLNFMHRSSDPPVMHRDVKSANMVLDQALRVKLIDCGIAKLLSAEDVHARDAGKTMFTMAATAGGVLGTPGYMCPRYTGGGKFGEKSEVFSFGVVVLELLTGRLTENVPEGLYVHYLHPEDYEEELTPAAADLRAGPWPASALQAIIALAKTCVGAYKRRPTMQEALRQLRALEREHCQLTVGEVQLQVAGLQEQNFALVQSQQDELRRRYREVQQVERARAAALRTCCICYDEVAVADGIVCGGGEPHFVCNDCFSEHVLTESGKDLHDIVTRNGQVFCPLKLHGCSCDDPYPENAVAAHSSAAVFGAFIRARDRLKEQQLVHDMEVQFEHRLEVGSCTFAVNPLYPLLAVAPAHCRKPLYHSALGWARPPPSTH